MAQASQALSTDVQCRAALTKRGIDPDRLGASNYKLGDLLMTSAQFLLEYGKHWRLYAGVEFKNAHTAGDTTITVDAMTGTLKAGDLVKFAGDTKVYMVVSDVTADGSNEATLTIEPPLRSAISDNASVTYDGVEFTVRLTNDLQQFTTDDIDTFKFEVDFIEAL